MLSSLSVHGVECLGPIEFHVQHSLRRTRDANSFECVRRHLYRANAPPFHTHAHLSLQQSCSATETETVTEKMYSFREPNFVSRKSGQKCFWQKTQFLVSYHKARLIQDARCQLQLSPADSGNANEPPAPGQKSRHKTTRPNNHKFIIISLPVICTFYQKFVLQQTAPYSIVLLVNTRQTSTQRDSGSFRRFDKIC